MTILVGKELLIFLAGWYKVKPNNQDKPINLNIQNGVLISKEEFVAVIMQVDIKDSDMILKLLKTQKL